VQHVEGNASRNAKPFKTLNELIEESSNPESKNLKKEIDEIRGARRDLIKEFKSSERSLRYKEEEYQALSKLLEPHRDEIEKNKREIGRLKYLKRKYEFAIETEASSLEKEKSLIRKIKETDVQLNEALRYARMERKMLNIKGDIEQYRARIAETAKKIKEYDAKLDEFYAKLRGILNISKEKKQRYERKERPRVRPLPEINLEDIAVIKRKGGN
jgi:chromosome segregation ATPase